MCDAEALPSSGVNTTTIGGSASSSNVVFIVIWNSIAAGARWFGAGSGERWRGHRGWSRSVNFQGNVTGAFRQSEAELACSEFDIFTTRSPGPASLLERVEREGGKSVDRGDRLADRRGAHLGSMPAARAHRGSDTPEKVHTEGSRAWKRANALRPLAWARKK